MRNDILYSFDIFDTTLIRLFARPADLFFEMGLRLQNCKFINFTPEEWSDIRINCERNARKKSISGEVTLNEIYHEVFQTIGISFNECLMLKELEIAIEKEYLRPVYVNQLEIQTIHEMNLPVIFISDTYFTLPIVKDFFCHTKLFDERDLFYLSSENMSNKNKGELFLKCLGDNNISPSQLFHIGDNNHADYYVPQSLGIQCHLFKDSALNRYEKTILEKTRVPLNIRSLIAGICRYNRLCYVGDVSKKTIWNTSVNVAAIVLFGYVYWCLLTAKKFNIKRLYFISRDGQILSEICNIIIKKWDFPVESKYIYGSRHAWHFASIDSITEETMEWILDDTEYLSVYSIFERVNLNPYDFIITLCKLGFPQESWGDNLNKKQRKSFSNIIQEPSVSSAIIKKAKEYRKNTIEYFIQEGFIDDTKFAIVDIGWRGRMQKSLSRLLSESGIYPRNGLIGLYYQLESSVPPMNSDKLYAYLPQQDKTHKKLSVFKPMMELFVSADHGGTIRYEKKKENIVPILRSSNAEQLWGVDIQQKAIIDVTNMLTDYLDRNQQELSGFFSLIANDIFELFIKNPSKEETESYGVIKISEEQCDNIFFELAPKYTIRDFCPLCSNKQIFHHNIWEEGSKIRSGPLVSGLMKLKRVVSRFSRLMIK